LAVVVVPSEGTQALAEQAEIADVGAGQTFVVRFEAAMHALLAVVSNLLLVGLPMALHPWNL